jgi:hypothetical protein
MGAIILSPNANFCDLFVNKAGILPCADVGRVFGAAGKGVILQGSTLELKPFDEAGASIVHQLNLTWRSGLSRNHGGSR